MLEPALGAGLCVSVSLLGCVRLRMHGRGAPAAFRCAQWQHSVEHNSQRISLDDEIASMLQLRQQNNSGGNTGTPPPAPKRLWTLNLPDHAAWCSAKAVGCNQVFPYGNCFGSQSVIGFPSNFTRTLSLPMKRT